MVGAAVCVEVWHPDMWLDVLKAENTSLKEYNDTQMLYVGGILIIIGIMLGAVLPRLTGRKRKDGW